MVSKLAREKVAQVWCRPSTKKIVFQPKLAEAFAEIISEYMEALIWCSGSADFAEGGQAREGWLKICQPLLNS